MYGRRYITCRNKEGSEIHIGEKETNPFALISAEGLYTASNNVATTENTMIDGSTYHGSTAAMRNIVLTIANRDPFPENRAIIDEVFKEGDAGTLVFHEEGGIDKQINYYVESIDSDGIPASVVHTISLLCPDPFFYALHDVVVSLSQWDGVFEFIHTFPDINDTDAQGKVNGEPLGVRSEVRMAEIINRNLTDRVGMKLTIVCAGPVVNPRITLIETQEHIQVGGGSRPLNLVSGDRLIITTETGNKHVYLEHDGGRNEINYYLTEDSTFLQLRRGVNTIGYSAVSGDNYMTIFIEYRLKFARA